LTVLPPIDLNKLLTVEQAAEHCGVQPVTIRQWVSRGHLTPIARGVKGRLLFDVVDVAKAERATRERARRPAYSAA
jgi:excisionase family DNA binding protein